MTVPQFALLDPYSRRARLLPAMITIMPVAIAATLWLPALRIAPLTTILFSWFGIGVLLAEFSRDLGKHRQVKLWRSWGGSPTVRRLRLCIPSENAAARERWRARLATLAPDTPLLAEGDEANDPERADQVIEVCIARIRELTRDAAKFPLVFQENVSYGLRRNLWAMKPAAIFLIVVAIVGTLAPLNFGRSADLPLIVFSIACSSLMLTWWILRIRSHWVREAAERYADQLLWSCETIEQTKAAPEIRRVGF